MKVLVIGSAKSGNAAAKLLNKQGYEVIITDQNEIKEKEELEALGIQVVDKGHPEWLKNTDYAFVVKNPGIKYDVMLCLVGGQGAGKSTFYRMMAIKDEWFSDDLKRLEDENVYRKLQGHWFIEMAEMSATVAPSFCACFTLEFINTVQRVPRSIGFSAKSAIFAKSATS